MTNDEPTRIGDKSNPSSPGPAPGSRLEAEVLEILERSEQPIPFSSRVRRITWRHRRDRLLHNLSSPIEYVRNLGSRGIGIAALVSALLALFLNDAAPLVSRIAGLAFIVLIAMFFFVGFKSGGGGGPGTKRWRGQDVDFNSRRGGSRFRGPWKR